jgi:uncharacterized membrane protein (DUF485 family)
VIDASEEPLRREPAAQSDWKRIAASSEFRSVLAARRRFVIPAFAFFVVYYILLHILVGFAPRLMSTRVLGVITLAYVFALSQFVVGGVVAVLYLKASARLDALIETLLKNQCGPDRSSE